MITELPSLVKMSAVISGSGLVVFADSLDVSQYGQAGGWGLAVLGLVTFWKQAQSDRKKFDTDLKAEREKFMDDLKDERKERVELYAEQQKQNSEWKEAITRLTHCIEQLLLENRKKKQ